MNTANPHSKSRTIRRLRRPGLNQAGWVVVYIWERRDEYVKNPANGWVFLFWPAI